MVFSKSMRAGRLTLVLLAASLVAAASAARSAVYRAEWTYRYELADYGPPYIGSVWEASFTGTLLEDGNTVRIGRHQEMLHVFDACESGGVIGGIICSGQGVKIEPGILTLDNSRIAISYREWEASHQVTIPDNAESAVLSFSLLQTEAGSMSVGWSFGGAGTYFSNRETFDPARFSLVRTSDLTPIPLPAAAVHLSSAIGLGALAARRRRAREAGAKKATA